MNRMLIVVVGLTTVLFVSQPVLAQSDTTRVAQTDSSAYNPNAIAEGQKVITNFFAKYIGADFFATGEFYGFHLGGPSATTMGGGPGIELRFRPVYLGCIVGVCGDEGIPGLYQADNTEGGTMTYSYTSVYGGVSIDSVRFGVGLTNASNSMWVTNNASSSYTSAFLEVSRRIGGILFLQPQAKVVYPVVAHFFRYASGPLPVTQHYHLRDLYFSIGLKLGIGVN